MEAKEQKLGKILQALWNMGISFDMNWRRFAIMAALEKWNNGWAWAIELGPFSVMRTPPNEVVG